MLHYGSASILEPSGRETHLEHSSLKGSTNAHKCTQRTLFLTMYATVEQILLIILYNILLYIR